MSAVTVLVLLNLALTCALVVALSVAIVKARHGPSALPGITLPGGRKYVRYVVMHGEETRYNGHDSDAAVAAWQTIEHAPDEHPKAGHFYENGRIRAHRPATSSPSET